MICTVSATALGAPGAEGLRLGPFSPPSTLLGHHLDVVGQGEQAQDHEQPGPETGQSVYGVGATNAKSRPITRHRRFTLHRVPYSCTVPSGRVAP
jgi:hypothetical protein